MILADDDAAVQKASQAYLEKLLEQIKPLVDGGTWAKIHALAMAHAGGVATGQKRAAEREAAAQAAVEPAQVEKCVHVVTVCKAVDEQRMIYGVVIEPGMTDLHGEVISEETCRKAAHGYMATRGGINLEHPGLDGYRPDVDAQVVESVLMAADVPDWYGRPVRKGAWVVGIHVASDEVWKSAKAGQFGGLSLEGTARRQAV